MKQFKKFLLVLIVHLQAKCQESHDDDYGFISNLVTCLLDNPLQTHAKTTNTTEVTSLTDSAYLSPTGKGCSFLNNFENLTEGRNGIPTLRLSKQTLSLTTANVIN